MPPSMPSMRERVAELERRRAQIREMGGPDKIAKQHGRGKLTCRERLGRLFDDGVIYDENNTVVNQ